MLFKSFTPRFNLVSALCAAILALCPLAAQSQAMVTSGQFNVGQSGEATYTVPIQVPPGIAGMEPKIALTYSSQAGNGIAGLGWTISGLSAITRCPQTMLLDGANSAVKYDANDRFCMDGQRLMLTNGSATLIYGDAGTEYRTEQESFSRITFNGTSFVVQTKAGLTMEYGVTADSRIERPGLTTVSNWLINKTTDVVGNYLTYTYIEDNANGDVRVDRIDYTGMTNGAAPTNSVRFVYPTTNRVDSIAKFYLGKSSKMLKRLSNVKTYVGSQVVKDYQLTYDTQTTYASDRSRLINIKECNATSVCLLPITFTWDATINTANTLTDKGVYFTGYSGWYGSPDRIRNMDVNGDGLQDIVIGPESNGNWYKLLNTGSGYSNQGQWFGASSNWLVNNSLIKNTNLNGDSIEDILIGPSAAGEWFSIMPSATGGVNMLGMATGMYGTWNTASSIELTKIIDVDNDGLPDVLLGPNNTGKWYLMKNNGTSFTTTPITSPFATSAYTTWGAKGNFIRPMDVDGDGYVDMVLGPDSSGKWYVMKNNAGNGFVDAGAWPLFATNGTTSVTGLYGVFSSLSTSIRVVDLNGDGLQDLLLGPDVSGNWKAMLSTGTGFNDAGNWGVGLYGSWGWSGSQNRIRLFDLDGDGLLDVLIGPDSIGQWYGLKNTGTNFVNFGPTLGAAGAFKTGLYGGWYNDSPRIRFVDNDGDGLQDILIGPSSTGQWYSVKTKAPRWRIVGVNAGSQYSTTEINYQALTETSATGNVVYTLDTGTNAATSPRIDIRPSMQVVSRVVQSNGMFGIPLPWGTTNGAKTDYFYGGLKVETGTHGRGMLGFRWQKSVEISTAINRLTEFSQTWPYVGAPIKSKAYISTGPTLAPTITNLSESNTSYACKVAAPLTIASAIAGVPSITYTAGQTCPTLPTNCSASDANKFACSALARASIFTHPSTSTEQSWDLNGAAMPTTTTSYSYGLNPGDTQLWGDPTQITVTSSSGASKVTDNEYYPANTTLSKWILGRLKKATVTSTQ